MSTASVPVLGARGAGARRFNRMMAVLAVTLTGFDLIAAHYAHLGSDDYFFGAWYSLALLAGALWYCRWRPLPRLVDACELAMWAVGFTNILSVLIQLAGRSPAALVDRQLARIDAEMHFSTAAAVTWAAHVPAVRIPLALSYALTGPLIVVAVLLPPLVGRAQAARRYMLGIVLALIVTAAAFAAWPAAGPWTSEGFAPTREQAAVDDYLTRLKSPGPATLDMQDAGIVAFPSFHVVLAILTAVALSAVRRLRVAAWALAGLVAVSTLTTGWHYLTDILGGIALAAVSFLAARIILPGGDDTVDRVRTGF